MASLVKEALITARIPSSPRKGGADYPANCVAGSRVVLLPAIREPAIWGMTSLPVDLGEGKAALLSFPLAPCRFVQSKDYPAVSQAASPIQMNKKRPSSRCLTLPRISE